ncbi:hypothetical protein C8Q74DRAFT_1370199 [Fomes fomentarius]|nr:hypothetical protein C8Q74DRAFT_1370199 [Fomes fomentarius]
MSRPNSPRAGIPSPRPVGNAGDVRVTSLALSVRQLKAAALQHQIRADVAPPRVLKTQFTHVDQAARAVYNALASVVRSPILIEGWDENDYALIETLAHELEDGVLPLSALLWDGEWSRDKAFVANAMYAWEKAQKKEIGSEDQEAATAKGDRSLAFKVSKL